MPRAVAAAWTMPLLVGAAAASSVAFLERRLNTVDSDTTSVVSLAIALSFIVMGMLVSYRPLFMLSSIMRRLGSATGALARWIWVPISLVIAGVATLVGLRAGGAYGDGYEGVVPAWALGIVALPPLAILLALGWRGGRAVEEAIGYAFDRRKGRKASGVGRRWPLTLRRALRADARPGMALDTRRNVRVVPGADIVRLALMTTAAAFAIWQLGLLLDEAETVVDALTLCGLQVAALYVPLFLLERSAVAVGARRGPLRLAFAISAVLLIHIQASAASPRSPR